MGFQLSAGVNVSEIDLTTVVPAVATSDGAIAGVYRWGPVGQRVLVDSENQLAFRFGKPTNFNAETWFVGANFLSYGNRLYVSRGANTSGATPSMTFTATSGNTTYLTTNTAGLSNGMYVFQSSNTSVIAGSRTTTINVVNSTAITTSIALATNSVALYFGNPGTTYTAVATAPNGVVANLVNQIVKNEDDYTNKVANSALNFDTDVNYVAKYPGGMGNSLKVSQCDTANSYTSNIAILSTLNFAIGNNVATAEFVGTSNASAGALISNIVVGDNILAGNSAIGYQYLSVKAIGSANSGANTLVTVNFQDPYRLHTSWSTNNVSRFWEYFNVVGSAPGQSDFVRLNGNTSANDELHIVVADEDGLFTGTPGTILEVYKGLSRATDAKNNDGAGNYYADIINQNSNYIWFARDRSTATSANAVTVASATSTAAFSAEFKFGNDGFDEANTSAFSAIASAYDLFVSPEDIDISLVMTGRPLGGSTVVNGETVTGFQMANYVIDNILETRKDCLGLVSPDKNKILNNIGNEATGLKNWRGAVRSSSYAFLDSGYKYQYDRYNDVYRWIPLNGDIAGLCVRTDASNDAWWSPAGFNRGQIKNLVKLAYNPRKADRDILYSNGINPVVTFPGQGTILYGDKTLQAKPSAFDRVNVRRLFIVLEKAISRAAQYSLFEFNDAFTRAQFKNLVVPYLRTIQGRRGITDFLVVCDDTNNTPEIIDTNQFVGDIYVKPARSINYISLNFVAVGTGVQFSEVVGKF